MDKVSVIIPVYKVEKYLEKCLDSVINQTYQNLEIILIDDGSPDNCGKICDIWEKKDKRIVVIHQVNMGLAEARNQGLRVCTGNYVYFVDSDDILNTQCIEKLLSYLKRYDADIACCNVYDFKVEDELSNIDKLNEKIDIFNNVEACSRIRKPTEGGIGIVVWNKLYKKDIFTKYKFNKGLLYEDEAIIYQLIYSAKKVVYTHEWLHYYRVRVGSIMRSSFSIRNFDYLKAISQRVDFLKNKELFLLTKNRRLYLHLLVYYRYIAIKKLNFSNSTVHLLDKEIDKIYNEMGNGEKNLRVKLMIHFPNVYGFLVYIKNRKEFKT